MTTASVVRYSASDAEDEARAHEFGRLIRKLRQELEKNNELRDLTIASDSASSDRAGVLDLNVMIRRALAQAAPHRLMMHLGSLLPSGGPLWRRSAGALVALGWRCGGALVALWWRWWRSGGALVKHSRH